MSIPKIKDINFYNNEMDKSIDDKLFFINQIPQSIVIDYGCGNGNLLKKAIKIRPQNTYVGYDISLTMKKNFKQDHRISFFTNFCKLKEHIKNIQLPVVIVLSSVLHEIYYYNSELKIKHIWDSIYDIADYIVIRDMIPSQKIDRKSNPEDVARLRKKANPIQLKEFEDIHGTIDNNKNLIHFLLKYRYKKNWKREVKENYFSIIYENFLKQLRGKIVYKKHYILKFIYKTVLEDFDIKITNNTHLKLITKNNNPSYLRNNIKISV